MSRDSEVRASALRRAALELRERGWSQRAIARELGTNQSAVCRALRAEPVETLGDREAAPPEPVAVVEVAAPVSSPSHEPSSGLVAMYAALDRARERLAAAQRELATAQGEWTAAVARVREDERVASASTRPSGPTVTTVDGRVVRIPLGGPPLSILSLASLEGAPVSPPGYPRLPPQFPVITSPPPRRGGD